MPAPAALAAAEHPSVYQQLVNARAHVHRMVAATQAENRRDYRHVTPYLGWPDRYRLPGSVWRAAFAWRDRLRVAVAQRPLVPWSSSWLSAMRCISRNEEYGFPDEGGHNSPAGFFGMPSTPSAYPGSSAIVARYGNSWWSIPFSQQLWIAWAEYRAYGWSPWSTAPGCGLG